MNRYLSFSCMKNSCLYMRTRHSTETCKQKMEAENRKRYLSHISLSVPIIGISSKIIEKTCDNKINFGSPNWIITNAIFDNLSQFKP